MTVETHILHLETRGFLSFPEKLEGIPSIPEKKLLSQPVALLELSSRSRRCLNTLEIETIEDLLEKKPEN